MTVAERLCRMLTLVLGAEPALRLRAWDGTEAGPAGAPVVEVRSRDAIRRLVRHPDELGLARAYVNGELDVEGDLHAALAALPHEGVAERRLTLREHAELTGLAVRLGALGREPDPPPEEVVLEGDPHSRSRDRAAISHHYDVGNDFYRLVLGESMVYSCAYWRSTEPGYTLEHAQRDKLDLVCRKLGLHERGGETVRLLDLGCGWGSLVVHAASTYGVRALGVTLSAEQAELARKRVAQAGLADLVEVRLQDYRDVADGPFTVIASIGMAEHVGREPYRDYAGALYQLLAPGGRLLNHQIARRPGPQREDRSFISAYVFPDGELLPLATTVEALEDAGFEVRDVESLREHYRLTLRHWVENLEGDWDRAVELSSTGRARVWRLYMAGSALAFGAGRIGVNQVLAVRTGPNGASGLPMTRRYLADLL